MRKHKITTIHKFGIFVCIFTLIVSQAGINNKKSKSEAYKNKLIKSESIIDVFKRYRKVIVVEIKSKKQEKKDNIFIITAYDLSVQSCGKTQSHSDYGISRGGVDLKNKTWNDVRVISVDPNVIPLGSKVKLNFVEEKYKKYNGIYIACDTGSAIKNNKIDFFLGDFHSSKPSSSVINFGKTIADVTILED